MVITRETDYALRILRILLDDDLHTVGEIASAEMIPQPFAYKIIKKLSKAGIIQVVRGAAGGCRLAADLSQRSLYDLMMDMGEKSSLSSCMEPDYMCSWKENHGGCTIHCQLAAIQSKLDQELQAHSLWHILTGGH